MFRQKLLVFLLFSILTCLSVQSLYGASSDSLSALEEREIESALNGWFKRRELQYDIEKGDPRRSLYTLLHEDNMSLSRARVRFFAASVDTFRMDVALVFVDSQFIGSHVSLAEQTGRNHESGLHELINTIITESKADMNDDSLLMSAAMLFVDLAFPRSGRKVVHRNWVDIPRSFHSRTESDSLIEKFDESDFLAWLERNDSSFKSSMSHRLIFPFLIRSGDTTRIGYFFWQPMKKWLQYERMIFVKGKLKWMATGSAYKTYTDDSWGK